MLPAVVVSSVLLAGAGALSPASADDHFNLESGLPVTVEDAYAIEYGGKELQSVFTYERTRDSDKRNLFSLEPRLAIGLFPNFQLTPRISYSLGDAEERNSGTAGFDALYQLNQEAGLIPVVSVAGSLDVPYGFEHGTPETGLKLIVAKTIPGAEGEEKPDVHLNLEWIHNYDPTDEQRADRYAAGIAYSQPISETVSLVGDVVREQKLERAQAVNLVEFGARFRVLETLALAAGVGIGFGPNSPGVQVTVGFQRSLDDLFGKP